MSALSKKANYSIYDKVNKETKLVTEIQLFKEVELLFNEASTAFHSNVFNRIVDSPNYPFNNELVEIKCVKVKKSNKAIWPKKLEIPINDKMDVGKENRHNEWIVYNNVTNKYCIFPNMAILARTMKIKYSYLYNNIKYSHSFNLGNFTFSHSSMLEKDFYKNKIQEIL